MFGYFKATFALSKIIFPKLGLVHILLKFNNFIYVLFLGCLWTLRVLHIEFGKKFKFSKSVSFLFDSLRALNIND